MIINFKTPVFHKSRKEESRHRVFDPRGEKSKSVVVVAVAIGIAREKGARCSSSAHPDPARDLLQPGHVTADGRHGACEDAILPTPI